MPRIRKIKFQTNPAFHELISTASRDIGIAEGEINRMVEAWLERCKAERRELKTRLIDEAKARGDNSYITMSRFSLTTRLFISLEIDWQKTITLKGTTETTERRVAPSKKGEVSLRTLVQGAHPEEVEVIKRHELEARQIRQLWVAYIAARTAANRLLKSLKTEAPVEV